RRSARRRRAAGRWRASSRRSARASPGRSEVGLGAVGAVGGIVGVALGVVGRAGLAGCLVGGLGGVLERLGVGTGKVAEAGQAREHLAQLGELAGHGVALAGELGHLALGRLAGDLGVGLGLEHQLLGL